VDVREEILSDVMGEIEEAASRRAVAARRGPVRGTFRVMAGTAVAAVALVGTSLVTGASPAYAGTCGQPDPRAASQIYSCRSGTWHYLYESRFYSISPYPHYCYVFWTTVKSTCAFGQFYTTACA
jgi:hypothetical protein